MCYFPIKSFLVCGYKHKYYKAIAKWRGCMSNECWRVIMQHALTEIHEILQIEENISISCQTLAYVGRGMVAVHFLPESQYPGMYR